MSKYARVERRWPGGTAVCIGAGPSVTPEDVAHVQAWRDAARGRGESAFVIVVNTTFRLAMWADALFACDYRWFSWHWKGAINADGTRGPAARDFAGLKYALTLRSGAYPGVQVLNNAGAHGISDDPTALYNGSNSGYQAINLAYLFGATTIVLLGYDMQTDAKRREHWHGDHPNRSQSPYDKFRRNFNRVAPLYKARHIRIVNASRATALTCFERVSLTAALPLTAALQATA
jgi:hypothetical protein